MSGNLVDISIVIPCHAAHANMLPTCLRSLLAQKEAHAREILVVNSNGDPEVAQAVVGFPVRLLEGGGRLNAGAARNLGVAAATGELVAFIDADCAAAPSWLTVIAQRLTGKVIALSGPVLDYLAWHPIATVDNRMQFVDQLPGRPDGSFTSAPSCNLAVRRSAFLEIGGFPDVQPGEDTILTARLAEHFPHRTLFNPMMIVRHHGRTGFREFLRHQRDFGFGRGLHCLNLTPRQQTLCRHRLIACAAAIRRYFYLMRRTAQWKPFSAPSFILLTPLFLAGLAAWAQGLQSGCNAAAGE